MRLSEEMRATRALHAAKCEGLDLHQVKDGLIISAAGSARLHYLNPSAMLIFELCDGTNDPANIAALVTLAVNHDALPLEQVEECLRQLVTEQVLRV
jgi:hypothetical protein